MLSARRHGHGYRDRESARRGHSGTGSECRRAGWVVATTVAWSSSVETKSWAAHDGRGEAGHGEVVLEGAGLVELQVVGDVGLEQRDRQRDAGHEGAERDQHGPCVREHREPSAAVLAGVVEQHLRDAPEEKRLQADDERGDAEEVPVERQRERAEIDVSEARGNRHEETEDDEDDARLQEEEVRAVDRASRGG